MLRTSPRRNPSATSSTSTKSPCRATRAERITRTLQKAQDIDPTFPITAAVKGMLQRNTLGADMLKRLRVYAGADHGHQAQKPKVITFDPKGNIKVG